MSTTDVLKSNISNLYFAFFGHVPDPDGLANWVAQIQSNQATLADVATALASQPEATVKYSYLAAPNLQLNFTTFLNGVYKNLFHRNADAMGLATWSQELLSGRSAANVVLDVINGAQGTDATTLAQSVALTNVSPTDTQKVSIAQLYLGLLGRNADPSGLALWSSQLQSNQMSLQNIAQVFAASAEGKAEYTYLNAPNLQQNITTFLDGVYESLFHREIDPVGLAAWSSQLLAGQSAASVVLAISQGANGSDAQALSANAVAASLSVTNAYKASVTKLYMALFGRAADPASLNNWVGQLNAGQTTLAAIADAMVLLPEAKAAHAYLSATNLQLGITDFLNEIYQNLFHRNADGGGITAWTNALLTGSTAANLVLSIIAGAASTDVTAIANRTSVALQYTGAVLAAGVNWTVADDRADAVQVLAGVSEDPATLTPAGTLITTLVAAEAAPFILTASSPSVNEGSNVVFTLATKGIAAGSLYNYQLSGVQAADVQGGALTGTAVIDAQGKALISIGLVADNTTEGNETLTLSVAGQSSAVTVVDTSLDSTNFTLSAGVDSVTGTPRNDTITSTVPGGLGVLDTIDGGAGTDTLNVSDTSPIVVAASANIRNVEIANLTSAGTVTVNSTGWTGLTNLNAQSYAGANTLTAAGTTAVSATSSATGAGTTTINGGSAVTVAATGLTTGAINVGTTIAPTGAINVTDTSTGAVNMGVITVTGGTTVNVSQATTNAVNTTTTLGTVTVNGGSGTTAVTVNNQARATASSTVAGVTANTVAITDVNGGGASTTAGTITSASVSGYTTLGISDNALTALSIANGSGNIIIDNSSSLATPTNTTLNLTVSGLTGGTLDDADIYRTLNVTTTGTDSTLANNTFGGLTTLTVGGTKRLTLTSTAGLSALQTVTVTGSAGLAANLTGATVKAIDTSGTTGASTITMDASKATFTGGAGADTVTVTNGLTKAISLGAGDDSLTIGSIVPTAAISGGAGTDTLSMDASAAATASGSQTFAGLVTGFEQLVLTGSTNQTIDLAVLGIANQVTTHGGNGLTLSNLVNGGRLVLDGAGTAYTIGNSAFAGGTNDTVNITLKDSSGSAVSFATTGITASGVENLVVTTVDGQATPSGSFNDFLTLLGNSSKTVTVSGNAGLTLTQTSTGLTSVDASGITLGGFTYTSGALASAATIKGSATGTNTVDFSAATQTVTYTGGSGNDAITNTSSRNDTIALGDGTNSFTTGNGNNTITAGSGSDTVTVGSGNNTVNLGDGANSFTATSGNNTYVGGAGVDTVSVGGGFNTVTLGAGANVFTQTAVNANLNTYSTILDPRSGDTMVFLNQGTETFNTAKVVLAGTAVFQDYADAVIQQGGDGSVNGHFGWFQYSGDTYLVEDRHNGTSTPSFSNGTDIAVKLSGLVDLSGATLNSSANSLLLA